MYEYFAFRGWSVYEWSVNVSDAHPAEIIKSYCHLLENTGSEFLITTEYLVLNLKSNIGTYGHNLLAYEHNASGCKFAPGC